MSHASPLPGALPASVLEPAVAPYRRGGTVPRRRRRGRQLWAFARRAVTPIAVVASGAAVSVWVLSSPSFAVSEVRALGTGRVSERWVRQALAPLAGRNLLLLPLSEVRERLAANPWVASAGIAKELPGRLEVSLVEKKPAALVKLGSQGYWAEADGKLIAPLAVGEEALGLPTLVDRTPALSSGSGSSGEVPRALALLAGLGKLRPDWTRELAALALLGGGDFSLETRALPFPLLLEDQGYAAKVERLGRLLPEIEKRYPHLAAVDLRFSRRIILVPAAEEPAGEAAATPAAAANDATATQPSEAF